MHKNMKSTLSFLALCMAAFMQFQCTKTESELSAQPGGVSGSITRFAVYRGYLYGLDLNKVVTYDLSNPDQPKLVHTLATDYGLETITVYDNYLYIGSTTSLYILDVANPSQPSLSSQTPRNVTISSGCDPVAVKGNYAYSTVKIIANICGNISSSSALIVYDVTNKTAPQQVALLNLNVPNGLGIMGDYLLVCDEGSDKVEVIDIKDPRNPILMPFGFPLIDPVDLIVNGSRVIVSTKTSFDVYDVADLTNPRKLASIDK
jgi:hypothetical protein